MLRCGILQGRLDVLAEIESYGDITNARMEMVNEEILKIKAVLG